MIQIVFIALLVVTLFAGAIAYFNPSHKPMSPMQFVMETSGLNRIDSSNSKRSQQINMMTSNGLLEIHRQMDDIAVRQNKFLDTLEDQQQILKDANKDTQAVLLEAQKAGAETKDILQLQALSAQIEDEQRLLVTRGQYLVTLNNRLMKNRQWVLDQVDLTNSNTQASLNALQQRYALLQNQATTFMDKISQYNQEANSQMNEIGDHLYNLTNNASFNTYVQQQNIKDRIDRMLEKNRENMRQMADANQRNNDLLQDAQGGFDNSKQQAADAQQRTQDLIDEERQKQEDRQPPSLP